MEAGVYIVGTPIGNLADISSRALDTLRSADLILAEDTRQTLILLQRYQIRKPMISCHRDNEHSRVKLALDKATRGAAVAVVSSAGMPGVSDPGSRIVSACRQQGVRVTIVPGPSAVTCAVALCGFLGNGFRFEGFLPHRSTARRKRLGELILESCPVVFFESPYRGLSLLADLAELFGERELFIGRELTKKNEECLWGGARELAAVFQRRMGSGGSRIKGELVVVIAPAAKSELRAALNRKKDEEREGVVVSGVT